MTLVRLPPGSWWDWEVLSYDGWQLRLAAGYDLTYHHDLELVFTDVAYLACPTRFSEPEFREPSAAERDLAIRYGAEPAGVVVAFDVDSGAGALPPSRLGASDATPRPATVSCLVAAASVEVVTGLVYRYWREDLKEGERLAPFVRPPDQ